MDLDWQDKYSGATALIHAAAEGHVEILQMLIDAKANLDLKDKDGFTALMRAAERGRMNMVQMLIDAGARTGFMCRFFSCLLL